MPDSTSPFDDPFADLFGKLPDARQRRGAGDDGAHGGGDLRRRRPPQPAPGVPMSRREAREAAARQAAAKKTRGGSAMPAAAPAARVEPAPAEPVGPRARESRSRPHLRQRCPCPFRPWERMPRTNGPSSGHQGRPRPSYRRGGDTVTSSPAATATLEDLFTGEHTTDSLGEVPPPKDKRKRRIGGWIALGVVLLLFGGVAAGGLWVWNTYEDRIRELMGWEEPKDYEPGMANGEAFVTIASGDTGGPISEALYNAGVTKTPEAFYDYLIDTGQNPPFVPGLLQAATADDLRSGAGGAAGPREQAGEHRTAARRAHRRADRCRSSPTAPGCPIEDFQAAVADPAAYGVRGSQPGGLAVPGDVHIRPRSDGGRRHHDARRPHGRVARLGRSSRGGSSARS